MKHSVGSGNKLWRGILVLVGIAILVWSGVEDNDAMLAAALGLLTATAASMNLLHSRAGSRAVNVMFAAMVGLLTGGLSSLATAALMLFKDLRHGHVFPDYPPEMIMAVLKRLPPWAFAGGLAGIGIGLLLKIRGERRNK